MSLRQKTLAVFGAVIALVAVLAVASSQLIAGTLERIEEAEHQGVEPAFISADMKLNVIQVQQWLTDISATQAAPGFDDGFDEAALHADAFRNGVVSLAEARPDLQQTLDELLITFEQYYAQGIAMAEAYIAGGPNDGNLIMGQFDAAAAAMAEGIDATNNMLILEATTSLDEAEASAAGARQIVVIVSLLTIAVAIAIALAYSHRLAARLGETASAARHLARGETDFELSAATGSDEIDEMSQAFGEVVEYLREASTIAARLAEGDLTATFQPRSPNDTLGFALENTSESLRSLISSVDMVASQVAEGSQALAAGSQETASTATQTAGAVGQVADNADRQSMIAAEVSGALHDIVRGAEQTSGAVQVVADSAQHAEGSAGTGMTQIQETQQAMDQIISSFSEVRAVVEEVGQRAAKVDEIVDLIRTIAEQTNLLALNAAIEAARAGESGRGFAVVASEVKALAEESATSTEEIARIVEAMLESVDETTRAMETGRQHIEHGNVVVASARTAFESIVDAVGAMKSGLGNVTTAAGSILQSAAAVERESSKLVTMAGSNSAVAQQLAAGAEEVAAASEEVGATAQDLEASASELQSAMRHFTIG